MKTEKVLLMQIMGASALVLRPTASGMFTVEKVGPNFTGSAHEGDLVTLIEMQLPVAKGRK